MRISKTTLWAVSAIALLGFVACGDPDDTGDTTDTSDTSQPTDDGTITGEVYILDEAVDCDVNLNDSYAGPAWEPIAKDVGTYDVTAGDLGRTSQDGLPLVEHNGRDWVAPKTNGKVEADTDTPVRVDMNQYVSGQWTCEDDTGYIATSEAQMTQGYLLRLPGLYGNMTVSGVNVEYDDGTDSATGSFTSAITATFEFVAGSVPGTAECWQGGENDRPTQ